jgi:SAM-dependent methyltransferase
MSVDRPDVRAAFPRKDCQGYRAIIDVALLRCAEQGHSSSVRLQLVHGSETLASVDLKLGPDVMARAAQSARNRSVKREWLKMQCACPMCGGDLAPDALDRRLNCSACSSHFSMTDRVVDCLPTRIKQEFHIDSCDAISAHPYDEVAKRIVTDAKKSGGHVLDCGSGLRPESDESVICTEIVAYPNVDVLAVNQRLPFRTGTFDAVLSLNVLEHVTDPFASASELVRVLKPGGVMYCCIPFLQPEHGYPHHYFNATRSGLRELFSGKMELLDHFVPRSGEPIWTLHWFASWYSERLPHQERKQFLQLRMQDLINRPALELLNEPWVRHLSEDGRWRLASTTAAVMRKL